jgi:hypothetical protein
MQTLTTEKTPAVQARKFRVSWQRWLIILGVGVLGGLVESEQHYPADSQADVQAVETAIGGLLDAAHTDNMPRMVERNEFVAATGNFSQAMSNLLNFSSNLNEPPPSGATPLYPNYNLAWDRFVTAFGQLHIRNNRLKATVLYYDAAGWYPNPPTNDHDWRKLNQSIPWELSRNWDPERIGYAIGSGGTVAFFAWLAIIVCVWAWNFILARIRDMTLAAHGH